MLALEDVLGEVLATARTGGVLTVQAELTAPWGIQFPDGPVAAFHILTSGSCLVRTRGASTVRMVPGDVVLFTRGSAHALLSGPAARPVPFSTVRCDAAVGVPVLRLGGEGASSSLLCGVYRFDRSLPQVAELVGYDSAYAFNRAFTRARGVSPGRYRRGAA